MIRLLLLAAFLFPLAASAAPVHDFRALVFSKTAGFRHDSIDEGIAAIEALGLAHDFEVDATEDASVFTDDGLAAYSVVIFLNTTGDVLNPDQEAAFERFIQGGGGYVGVHAATDTEYNWDWYGELVGAYFDNHPPGTASATVKVLDRTHPSTEGLPAQWVRTDEWYSFRDNPRGDVHVLATLDESTYSGGTMGTDHPIAWCHGYDGGRAWYTAGGHTPSSYDEPLFREHLLHGIEYAAGAVPGDCGATVGDNFDKVILEDEVENPLDLAPLPDGRVLFVEKNGAVKLHNPETGFTSVALSLSVYTGQEDGLLGVVLDPGFAQNGWVYLYYSPAGSTPKQHLSRFTLVGSTLDRNSEVILLEIPTQRDQCCHSGGSLAFDADGNLFLSTGDNTNPFDSDGYAPIDGRAGRAPWDARRTSGNPDDLRGKIIRIHPEDDGTYSIPDGNLFPNGVGGRSEIYVMGVRNPFRISIDAATGRLYWGDVGPDAGGRTTNRGPEGFDEWNRADAAGNYGWPFCIADNEAYNAYDFATGVSGQAFDCDAPLNDSPHIAAPVTLPPAQPAWIWYPYASATDFPAIPDGAGRTALAGPVFSFDPTLDSDVTLPAYYDDTVFLYEWSRQYILEARLDENGDLLALVPFADGITWNRPIAMKQGPDGALYILEWGSGFGIGNADAQLVRLEYRLGARPPVVRMAATPTSGPLPLTVQFSSAGSFDPDPGDALTYAWDFTSDGTTDATTEDAAHTYTEAGTFVATLTITDPAGQSAVTTTTITAGNTRPEVTLHIPAEGGIYDWGDAIPYRVSVFDAEDGSTDDGTLDCANVVVQPLLGHDDHSHPLAEFNGCEGVFETEPGHGADADNLFYLVEATYTDAGGSTVLTGSDLHRLQPRRTEAEHATLSGGVEIETTGDQLGGGENIGFVDHGDYIAFDPISLSGINFVTLRVASAGLGGRIEARAGGTTGTLLGTGYVTPTGGWQTYTDVTMPLDRDDEGPFALYFVFVRNPGDGGLFNINWLTFHGPGVTAQEEGVTHGLSAVYYRGVDFSGSRSVERIDPQISFDWSDAGPHNLFPGDNFSVRWIGEVEAEASEDYTLAARSDDGIRVWLDGALVLDRWVNPPVSFDAQSEPVALTAGQRYDLTVEYFEGTGNSKVRLMWESASTPRQTIPESALFVDDAGSTANDPGMPLPSRLALASAYPNPFADAATFTFTLPTPGHAHLAVFDALGRQVALLADGFRPAGHHTVAWTPGALADGLYLVRLVTPGGTRARTVVRVR